MNTCFVAAAALLFLIGLVHSLLGERLIFRRMRKGGIVPVNGGQVLHESHVRIVWASWHIVTILGWCFAMVLWWLADAANAGLARSAFTVAIVAGLVGSAALVLGGTRGRHPGWIGLTAAALLAFAGMGG
jgi:hypothetical protein